MRNTAFDSFRDELCEAVGAVRFACGDGGAFGAGGFGHVFRALEVAFAGALRHGAQATHSAIGLEAAALVENRFAGRLVDAGETILYRSEEHTSELQSPTQL